MYVLGCRHRYLDLVLSGQVGWLRGGASGASWVGTRTYQTTTNTLSTYLIHRVVDGSKGRLGVSCTTSKHILPAFPILQYRFRPLSLHQLKIHFLWKLNLPVDDKCGFMS